MVYRYACVHENNIKVRDEFNKYPNAISDQLNILELNSFGKNDKICINILSFRLVALGCCFFKTYFDMSFCVNYTCYFAHNSLTIINTKLLSRPTL